MNVWIIEEENHGILGVAKTRELAIQYLIKTGWITEKTEFWDEFANDWRNVEEIFGNNWKEKILEKQSDFFDGSFYFNCYQLIK